MNAWESYDSKAKKKPVVPEPQYAGVGIFLIAFVVLYLFKRRK